MTDSLETKSFDTMVDVLSNVQRRKLLVALLEHNPQDDSPVVIADDESRYFPNEPRECCLNAMKLSLSV